MRIRTEEEIPVYERLGDARAVAITKGRVAGILEARDELDEALRIHTEESLPLFKRLGDARAAAITKGRVAGILEARGELDEALRIRTEEEIPVYERLGDQQSLAAASVQVKRLRAEVARRTRSGTPALTGDLPPARSPEETGRRGADAAQVAR